MRLPDRIVGVTLCFLLALTALFRASTSTSSKQPDSNKSVQHQANVLDRARQINFWHLTDVHLNKFHDSSGDVRDMCRSHVADKALHPGRFGHFNCDPALDAVSRALSRMKQTEPSPDFILFGGDVFGHVPASHENAAAVRESHRAIARSLRDAFPQTIILPCIGNHDTYPYFIAGNLASDVLADLVEMYGSPLSNAQRRSFATKGFYLHKLSRGLWIVVLETNALSLPGASEAASQQLAWLEGVLDKATDQQAAVLISGHIAPGASHIDWDSMAAAGWAGGGWTAQSQTQFYRIIRQKSGAVPFAPSETRN